MLRVLLYGTLCFTAALAIVGFSGHAYPQQLSDWHFFQGKLSLLKPMPGVVPYALNTPLYSDYAEKARFVRLPRGQAVNYKTKGVLDFPVGTILIKNFYYPADFRRPGIDKQIIETRLLIHEANEWKAITYVWNDEQTDARLEIAGDDKQVHFIDKAGAAQELRYVVPNQNQCKGCHNSNDVLLPIGPTIAQLNGRFNYTSGPTNQLDYWKSHGMLVNLPAKNLRPALPVWDDPKTGSLDARARAYLAVNCAHCHRREGPAQTSGLFLNDDEKDLTVIGINKAPVAAGKGSGGKMVDILPGDAEGSILWYRMQTKEPGERMPELGRNLVHKEGLALVRDWINAMK